jgi:hypothetical protein
VTVLGEAPTFVEGPFAAKPPPAPGPPRTPADFFAREAPKLAEKLAREGERFDAAREFQKLRDKYRKDVGEELPVEVEEALVNALRQVPW